jgi:hypothetical protein
MLLVHRGCRVKLAARCQTYWLCVARAKVVLVHPSNSHLVSTLPRGGRLVLDIGFRLRPKSCNTFATLERNDTDIILKEPALRGFNALRR